MPETAAPAAHQDSGSTQCNGKKCQDTAGVSRKKNDQFHPIGTFIFDRGGKALGQANHIVYVAPKASTSVRPPSSPVQREGVHKLADERRQSWQLAEDRRLGDEATGRPEARRGPISQGPLGQAQLLKQREDVLVLVPAVMKGGAELCFYVEVVCHPVARPLPPPAHSHQECPSPSLGEPLISLLPPAHIRWRGLPSHMHQEFHSPPLGKPLISLMPPQTYAHQKPFMPASTSFPEAVRHPVARPPGLALASSRVTR